ncbi:glycosyltransferase family 2 protein [Citrobacter freundii]|nr:glycosyltransferase family 2 protein [Citrobacter freundii]EIJ9081489.1 glycosyltransferase family 2 protein [Citrobacter freundii]EJH9546955.1 glycosyltransferase family 2 protein [Citrobacter freundii]EJO6482978.1 glycosyltransferase family 2 protein [Citrobacter freundii]EKW5685882.1 glycosyltransferase family 2 protein [Citrobacter freundii]EKX5705342.1 glycosyltransferase family 2 protein [Citrobacter freundii]
MNSSVTVTYNPDIECLKKQLQSLANQVDFCTVVDNGSSNIDEIEAMLTYLQFDLVKLDKNYGLAYAQNYGIKLAIEKGALYLLLLDQDSILDNGFVNSLKSIYLKYNVGILGASFYDPHTNNVYPGTSYKGPFISRDKINEITDVTFVIASGSFFSKEAFQKIGCLKNELFVDYIDVEWSLRAKYLGYRVAMTNKATMSHTIGDARINILGRTISQHSALRRYYLVRNSFYMLRLKYVPGGYKLRELFLNVLRSAIALVLNKNKKETAKKIMQGIADGVRGKYGSYYDR